MPRLELSTSRLVSTVAAMLLLIGCTDSTTQPSPAGATEPDVVATSGIDRSTFDTETRPQDDFFQWVNGGWLEATEIPADRSRWGSFVILSEQAQKQLRAIVDEVSAQPADPGTPEQRIRDLYLSFMNTDQIEARGLEPIRPMLDRIAEIRSTEDLLNWFAWANNYGIPVPVGAYVDQDGRDATRYLVHFTQWGLGLPDRDYYFGDDDRLQKIRTAYVGYKDQLFALAELPFDAAAVERIEAPLAEAQWTRVRNRDRELTYNLYAVAEAPGLPWSDLLAGMDAAQAEQIIIRQPDYPLVVAQLIDEIPLEDWRAYATFHLLDAMAPRLPAAFVDAHFDFHGRTLAGTEQNQPRWKRGIALLNNGIGEVLGQLYVARHFPAEHKERMAALVDNLTAAFATSIDNLAWMTPATQAEAQRKLAAFKSKIGYPDVWRDYSSLEIVSDDLIGNTLRIAEFDHRRAVGKLGGPIDREEWFMTPQTVNAYYSPKMNEIVFPAAILQPPFFNVEADDAINYGAIGAVIGHEISHGFDDQGSKSGGDGNLRDWWTEEDASEFAARTEALIAQYSAFEPLPGVNVNGQLTLGENIGDLSGLAVAWRAWQISLGGAESPEIDGFSGAERFFIGWAQVWRLQQREAALQRQILTDPHSPARYRTNGVLRNLDAFHATFETAPEDNMFLPADERVLIW